MARHHGLERHPEMAHSHEGWGTLVGFDPLAGIAAKAVRLAASLPVCFFVGDGQAMPFLSSMFDVVMAHHMLYHVPNHHRAVAEAARVVRPSGCFLATTNSFRSMSEYQALRR